MFDRKKYKLFARKMLENRRTVPALVTFIIGLITAIFLIPQTVAITSSPGFSDLIYSEFSTYKDFYLAYSELINSTSNELVQWILNIVAIILEMASLNVYLKMSRSPEKVSFSAFIEGFNNWWKASLGFIWQVLWTALWAMLFFIPGIIKFFSYSQMFMIMNEFENVSVTKSMRISIIITRGHKFDIFVMWLSFLGWDILGLLTLGILNFLWVTPYKQMTFMNAYHAMMKEALETGRIKPEDLQ